MTRHEGDEGSFCRQQKKIRDNDNRVKNRGSKWHQHPTESGGHQSLSLPDLFSSLLYRNKEASKAYLHDFGFLNIFLKILRNSRTKRCSNIISWTKKTNERNTDWTKKVVMKLKVKQKGFFYEIQQHSSSSSHSFTDRATGKLSLERVLTIGRQSWKS